VRPALACALIALAAQALPIAHELARGAIPVLALALAAPLVDPALRRDVRQLFAARGAPR
jgi:hypothetical protein